MDYSLVRTTWAKAVFIFFLIAASSQGAFVSRKAPKGYDSVAHATLHAMVHREYSVLTTNYISAIVSSYDEVYPVVVVTSDDKVRRR